MRSGPVLAHKALGLACTFWLASCLTSQEGNIQPLTETPLIYKQTLVITGPNTAVNQTTTNLLTTSSLVVPTLNPGPNLTLTLTTNTTEQTTSSTGTQNSPVLAGMLNTLTTTYTHQLNFTLQDNQGRTLTQGTKQTTTAPVTRISTTGQTGRLPSLDNATLTTLLGPIFTELQPHIQTQPWYAQVTSTVDDQHVILNVGQAHGLAVKHLFQTETRPITKLEVATFETYPDGTNRAVLRRLSGPLPRPGTLLIPSQ